MILNDNLNLFQITLHLTEVVSLIIVKCSSIAFVSSFKKDNKFLFVD